MKTEWLQVDTQDLNKEVTKTIRDVRVKVSLSPYDVPQMVRGFRETDSDFFVIELKYLTDEPIKAVQAKNAPIELGVGVNSGRIYRIKVDVVKLGCTAVGLEFVERDVLGAIEGLGASPPFNRLPERYKLTRDVISSYGDRLFSGAGHKSPPRAGGPLLPSA